MKTILDLLQAKPDLLWAAIVSAAVSALVTYFLKRRETRHKAEVEYEYEQRKKMRDLIGRFHGRLLTAANSMNMRLWNLYANQDKGWLDTKGNYVSTGYYFKSSVYRFLNVCALVRQLERDAVLLDKRIAPKKDFVFLDYAAALHWVMTDVALTEKLQRDTSREEDHFFSDHLRQYCDLTLKDGDFLSIEAFSEVLRDGNGLTSVLRYFDGLSYNEDRLRWDRLVAFHLLLMAFVNSFGYKRQYSTAGQFVKAARQIRHPEVLENLVAWIPKHDLNRDAETKKIVKAARVVCRAV